MDTAEPKKRINLIDAFRGFGMFGILMFHCMEHFDLFIVPEITSPFRQKTDTAIYETIAFLFSGKAYAIFSLLFGLSFYMQMNSQADKGIDFGPRFLWLLALLFVLGYINGSIYVGEFFLVYAVLGVLLIPPFKVPSKWLIIIAILLFLQIPDVVFFIKLLSGSAANEPIHLVALMDRLYEESAQLFIYGSFAEVVKINMWDGQLAKLLWVSNNARYPQLIGLFIAGMLIGRHGIHKSEEKMVYFSRLWKKNSYYGPVEWLWRTATWMKEISMSRSKLLIKSRI
ncbi:MAG: DUF418 domain-containing protein [Paludibacteraceae bacterium]